MTSKHNEGVRHPFGDVDPVKLVAYLRVQGMLEAEIGHLLFGPDLANPAPRVSRLLKEAKQLRVFREVFNEASMDPGALDELRTRASRALLPPDLLEKLSVESGGVLKDLRVFYSAPGLPKSNDWGLHLARFADNSAWFLRELLGHSRTGVAVGWGRTVFEMIQSLGALDKSRGHHQSGRRPVIVIPTVGDPLGTPPTDDDMSSSRLARDVSLSINGTYRDVPSLEGIVSVLPDGFDDRELRAIRRYIEARKGYRKVFGSSDGSDRGLISTVDTILTSVGSFESWRNYGHDLMIDAGVPVKELKRLCAADIGGTLAPHEGIAGDPKAQAAFNELTKRWTGTTLEHYSDVAGRAQTTSAPGVVVCAIGQNKARVVWELVVRLRLVNRLVIDQHLAKVLAGIAAER